jgi:hypothetical protein
MPSRVKLVRDLALKVAQDPGLQQQLQANPVTALANLASSIPTSEVWVYRIVVIALGLVALAAVIGAIVLAAGDKDIPQILLALGSAAVGALAGLLAPSPSQSA